MQNLRSLGLQTELMLDRQMGVVEEKAEYTVVRTPENPHYWYGNYLFFRNPPHRGSYKQWMQWFAEEFQTPTTRHRVFQWDNTNAEAGEHEEFLENGFQLSTTDVLTTRTLQKPSSLNQQLQFCKMELPRDVEALFALWMAVAEDSYNPLPDNHSSFVRQRILHYQTLLEQGRGNWWGAYLGEQLVGDMSLFFEGTLGRFQNVATHPGFRRQGICRSLLWKVASEALEEMPAATLIILAEADSIAGRIYRSLGFQHTETIADLYREPAESHREED